MNDSDIKVIASWSTGSTGLTLSNNKKIILQNFGQLGRQVKYVRHFFNFKCVLQMFI